MWVHGSFSRQGIRNQKISVQHYSFKHFLIRYFLFIISYFLAFCKYKFVDTQQVIQVEGTNPEQVADKKPACRSQFRQEIFEIQLYVPNPPSLGQLTSPLIRDHWCDKNLIFILLNLSNSQQLSKTCKPYLPYKMENKVNKVGDV